MYSGLLEFGDLSWLSRFVNNSDVYLLPTVFDLYSMQPWSPKANSSLTNYKIYRLPDGEGPGPFSVSASWSGLMISNRVLSNLVVRALIR